ncbi:MAG: acyltransferase domain-containing protein, partial [Candidatus Riflebacteria bacterium]|nr:acyltransferase domain-containing protein [Candidatus Riflebacteria bacterium]
MTRQERTPEPIAIIGMSCLFPRAQSVREYWGNIKGRIDAITEIPPTHWRPEDYFNADPKAPDQTYCRRGGFLPVTDFDPSEYGISPQALEAIDTSQLLGLVVASGALLDAGYGPDRTFDRSRIGVLLGLTGTLELVIPLGARLGHPIWRRALQQAGVPDEIARDVMANIAEGYVPWQENSFPGLLGNVAAGRIANRLNLGGTNCVTDAACGSSLSAVHLAVMELETGRADMVITGGVDTFNDIFMYMCFSKTPALTPTGDARPFSVDSDGTILGEGLGMVVLKRLADARAAGDHVYAVIRSVGTSSDGKGKAIYAPSATGQASALRRTYEEAKVTTDSVGMIEAHGTGTKVGDEIELTALKEVFQTPDRTEPWIALGSVKSQIGHTKAAAGAAGLIKAALALHHKVLPPTIKISQPNPQLLTPGCPFYLATELRPWFADAATPRRAGVSSFGFGGSNFHTLLEEAGPDKKTTDWDGRAEILAFSGATRQEVLARLDAFVKAPAGEPADIAAARARHQFRATDACRLTLVEEAGRTARADLLAAARTRLADPAGPASFQLPEGVWFSSTPGAEPAAVIFPGQGSQAVGMATDLVCAFPEAFDTVRDADRAVPGLAAAIYPRPTLDPALREQQDLALRATRVAQPALGAVGYGTFRVLQRFGFTPAATAGHSYGELPALCAAGAFDTDTLWKLSRRRGELMGQGSGDRGGMIAVAATRQAIAAVIAEEKLTISIANENAPEQTVLSGSTAAIQQAKAAFAARKIRATVLAVAGAFHSPLVSDAAEPFRAEVNKAGLRPTSLPVFANTTGQPYPADPATMADLLGRQLANPVRFVSLIEAMYDAGIRTFVETGPGNKIGGLIKAILGQRPHQVIAVDASAGKRFGVADLARALAALAALGHGVRLQDWEDGEARLASFKPRQRRM